MPMGLLRGRGVKSSSSELDFEIGEGAGVLEDGFGGAVGFGDVGLGGCWVEAFRLCCCCCCWSRKQIGGAVCGNAMRRRVRRQSGLGAFMAILKTVLCIEADQNFNWMRWIQIGSLGRS